MVLVGSAKKRDQWVRGCTKQGVGGALLTACLLNPLLFLCSNSLVVGWAVVVGVLGAKVCWHIWACGAKPTDTLLSAIKSAPNRAQG